jgi:hypothetical protein
MTVTATLLANNQCEQSPEWVSDWEDSDALADVAFAAGILGLLAGLMAVIRLSGTHFPDALFWRALPLLLVVPPLFFFSPLFVSGGLFDGSSSAGARAIRIGLSGLASYVAPVILLSIVAALACLR